MTFSLYGQEDDTLVEGVTQLQCIDITLKHTNNDWPSFNFNIGKAQAICRRLGKLM